MEAGIDWGSFADSLRAPAVAWDSSNNAVGPSSLTSSLDSAVSRNTSWGFSSIGSDFGSSAWSAPSSGIGSTVRASGLEQLNASRPGDLLGQNEPWKLAGSWGQAEEKLNAGMRSNSIGSIGWGKVPVCQGSTWEPSAIVKDSRQFVPDSEVRTNGSGSNDGTDIWRANLAKPSSGSSAVGTSAGMRTSLSVGDNMSWLGRDGNSQALDGGRQMFSTLPVNGSTNSGMWDNNSVIDGLAIAGLSIGPRNPVRFERRSPSLSSSWNTVDLPEADFGHWHQTPPGAAAAPTQQKIDDGTAVWGTPPALADNVATSRPNTESQPASATAQVPMLPFNIDFSRPPPPLYKFPNGPEASSNWNAAPVSIGTWGNATGEGSRPAGSTSSIDWTDSRKTVGMTSTNKFHSQPQMRARLIQQLMDEGYRKEDVQTALITYDMDVERARADLRANAMISSVGDGRTRQSSGSFNAALNNSMIAAASVPNNVYPPILPPVSRDKLISSAIQTQHPPVSSPVEPSLQEMYNKQQLQQQQLQQQQLQQQQLQQQLSAQLLHLFQIGILPLNLLPLLSAPLTPQQVVHLQKIIQLHQLLIPLRNKVKETPPGEAKEKLQLAIPQLELQVEMLTTQLSVSIKKPVSNGSSPIDNALLQAPQILKTDSTLLPNTLNLLPESFINGNMLPPVTTGSWAMSVASAQSPVGGGVTTSITSAQTKLISAVSSSLSNPSAIVGGQPPTSAASLAINEFVPGKLWSGENVGNTTAAVSDQWKAPGWGAMDGSSAVGAGLRRGSLTMSKRLDGSSSSGGSLSCSDWSLDSMPASTAMVKNDMAMSVPTVWSPIDEKSSSIVSATGCFQGLSAKSPFASEELTRKINGTDQKPELGDAEQVENSALKMLCNGWGDGSYEHGWSLGDDGTDAALLPGDLLTDQ